MKRTIAILLHDLSGGGSERIAIRLGGAWAAQGRRVFAVCGDPDGALKALIPPGVELVATDRIIRRGPGSRAALGSAAGALVRRLGADAVFVPGNYHIPAIPSLRRAMAGHPAVVVAKLSNPLLRNGRRGLGAVGFLIRLRAQLQGADAVVAMSPAFADEARRLLGDRRVSVIDEPILDDDGPSDPPEAKGVELLAAGRLVRQKNFGLALRAFALAGIQDLRLTILGEGPKRTNLQRLARRLGVEDRVSLPGHVPSIASWLRKSRLFLLPSRFEGYPAVVVEAVAAGVPVVATDCSPAIRDILSSAGLGRIVPPGDPAQFAAAILSALERPVDTPHDARDLIARHRLSVASRAYLDLIDASPAGGLRR